MIKVGKFVYKPSENEGEKASNSYLMSVVALLAGLPMPLINLIATLAFYFANKKATYYVKWHCTQALSSQFSLLIINTIGFWWTYSLIFGSGTITNMYIAYIATMLFYNLTEFVATVYTAIKTRKGLHVEWWFYGSLTNSLCREKPQVDPILGRPKDIFD